MPGLPEIVLIMNNLSTTTAQNNFCYSKNVSLHTYLWPIYGIQLVIPSAFSYNLLPMKQQPETIATIICHFDQLSLTFT